MTVNEYSERVRGEGTSFDRIRRITGYLVGNLDRFGTGKRAEEADRVKHTVQGGQAYVDFLRNNRG